MLFYLYFYERFINYVSVSVIAAIFTHLKQIINYSFFHFQLI